MKKLNWNSFEYKFNDSQDVAFERLAYALFCSMYNKFNGISALKNHPGLETDPIKIGNEYIGFQAKYSGPSVPLSSKKNAIINSLKIAKENESKLDVVHIFLNKAPSSPRKKTVKFPEYITDIEEEAKKLKIKLEWQFPSNLTAQLSNSKNFQILKEFFPELVEKDANLKDVLNKHEVDESKTNSNVPPPLNSLKNEDLLDYYRTAIIQIEISKIKYAYSNDWKENAKLISQFQSFVDFRNEIIAKDIFLFINDHVSVAVRSGMPSDIASSIFSLILTYFPSSFDDENYNNKIENGKECVIIGYNLVYDAFIFSGNFRIAQWGLNIWKYVYRESKRNKFKELSDFVLEKYNELENSLERPQREDLEDAKELVKFFKDDLETFDLGFPKLPEYLYKLTLK